MEFDPLEFVKAQSEEDSEPEAEVTPALAETTAAKKEKSKSQLNTYVAVTIALMSTFMGICKIKDDNIVQAMQQAQANKIDDWGWYQARNIREEVANSTVAQLKLQASLQPVATRSLYDQQITFYQDIAKRENQKKEQAKIAAQNDQKQYDQLNFHDDQFDLSEASLSSAIAILAITSLVQKRWLFAVTVIPIVFGVVMGLSGLLSWNIHPDALTKLLSTNPSKPSSAWLVTWK